MAGGFHESDLIRNSLSTKLLQESLGGTVVQEEAVSSPAGVACAALPTTVRGDLSLLFPWQKVPGWVSWLSFSLQATQY